MDHFGSRNFLSCFLSSASLASPQQYIILSGRWVFWRGPSQRKISILLRNLRRSNRFSPEGLNHLALNPLPLTAKQVPKSNFASVLGCLCLLIGSFLFWFKKVVHPAERYSNLCNHWFCGFFHHLNWTWDLRPEIMEVILQWGFFTTTYMYISFVNASIWGFITICKILARHRSLTRKATIVLEIGAGTPSHLFNNVQSFCRVHQKSWRIYIW